MVNQLSLRDRNPDVVPSMETLHRPVSPGISPVSSDTHRGRFGNLETSPTQAHTPIPHTVDAERDSDEDIVIFQGRN